MLATRIQMASAAELGKVLHFNSMTTSIPSGQTSLFDAPAMVCALCNSVVLGEQTCPCQRTITTTDNGVSFSHSIAGLNTEEETAHQAIERSGASADARWTKEALSVVHELCRTMPEFTTDSAWDVLDTLDISTHDPRALGAVMRTAAHSGWCEKAGRTLPSKRKVCHGRDLAVWSSRIYSVTA